MADLILGQPSNLTVMSAGVLGNQRVTFAPWELDWEFYAAINIGHWIANTITGQAFPITAKGGAENLGYWFEVDTPAGTWVSGQRCTPQRQLAIQQFPTFAAAALAMADDDVYLVWYANAANRRTWIERILWVDEGGAAWGMLSRCQISLIPEIDDRECVMAGGNLNAMVNPITVRNLGVAAAGEYGIRYAPVAVAPFGPGLIALRCDIRSATSGIFMDRCEPGTSIIGNCILRNCVTGVELAAAAVTVTVAYCNAMNCNIGYDLNPLQMTPINLVASECDTGYLGAGAAGCIFCADTDGSLPVVASNLRNQDARTNLRFFHDLARPGDKAFDFDTRTHYDSALRGKGFAVGFAPLLRDMDGVLRPAPPSIGAYEPRSTSYAPGAEMVRGALKRGANP